MNKEQAFEWLHGDRVEYSGCRSAATAYEEACEQLQAENARLAAENTALQLEQKMRLMAEESNARLKEELAAAQAESKRYRWLRDNECADVRIQHVGKRSWAALDFAIDEAIAKENGK